MKEHSKKTLFLLLLIIFSLFIQGVSFAAEEEESFTFAVVGDRTGGHTKGVFEQVMKEAVKLKPELIINVGDLIEGYSDNEKVINKEWDEVLPMFEETGIPYYLVPGNHDICNDISEKIYRERCAKPYYSFDYKGSHFIVLDASRVDETKPEDMPKEQVEWLIADLEKNKDKKHKFVFYHKPFWYESFKKNKNDQFHDIFVKYNVEKVFNGHYHTYCETVKDGVHYIMVGTSGGATSRNTDARGHFYNYFQVNVKPGNSEVIAYKLGESKPADKITMEDQFTFGKIDEKGIKMTRFPLKEDTSENKGKLEFELTNCLDEPAQITYKWTNRNKNWKMPEVKGECVLKPGEKKTITSDVEVRDISKIYPLPTLELRYDYGDKKAIPFFRSALVKRVAIASKIDGEIKIDGKLDEPCWKKIKPVTDFVGIYGQDSKAEKTEFFLAYDEKNLYIGTRFYDSKINALTAKKGERDMDLVNQDNAWIKLAPAEGKYPFYLIVANPYCVIMDKKIYKKDGKTVKDASWNGNLQLATGTEGKSWTMEMAIPFSELGGSPLNSWGLNLHRQHISRDADITWQLPYGYDPGKLGELIFKK